MKQSLIIMKLPYFKDMIKNAIESSMTMSLLSNLAFLFQMSPGLTVVSYFL